MIADVGELNLEALVALVSSLAFLAPALTARNAAQPWLACVFVTLATAGAFHHFCGVGAVCSVDVGRLAAVAHRFAAHFCLLEVALLVLGPEDPRLHLLDSRGGPVTEESASFECAPDDVVVVARVLPALSLLALHGPHGIMPTEDLYWWSLFVSEVLLVLACGIFWMSQSRRGRAPEVLVRFKYWRRVLRHGPAIAVMVLWLFCLWEFPAHGLVHALWHGALATLLVRTLRALLQEDPLEAAAVLDASVRNPSVAPVLLAGVALVALPIAAIGMLVEWCPAANAISAALGGDEAQRWPTLSDSTSCREGAAFLAVAAVPAAAAAAGAWWIIDSATVGADAAMAPALSLWSHENFEACKVLLKGQADNEGDAAVGKRLGCIMGCAGAGVGLLAVVATEALGAFSSLLGVVSLALLMVAMGLVASSAEAPTAVSRARWAFTMFLCAPAVAMQILLVLGGAALSSGVPHVLLPQWACAGVEYAVVALLSTWPLVWTAEVHETWQRKSNRTFAWPTTSWRFI